MILKNASAIALLVAAAWPVSATAIEPVEESNLMLSGWIRDDLDRVLRTIGGGDEGSSSCQAICLLWSCSANCAWWQTAHCSCSVLSVDLDNGITIGVGEADCYCDPPWDDESAAPPAGAQEATLSSE